jgi:Zn-dependent protease with chaperone function
LSQKGCLTMWPWVLNLFLYFPEDKREYIPAVISMTVFLLIAVFTMRLIIVISRRQEKEAERLEQELYGNKDESGPRSDV